MNEIRKLQKEKMVDARQLHEFLGSKQMFAHWIKKKIFNNATYKEGVDFIIYNKVQQNKLGGHNRKDYLLTAEVAKKITIEAQSREKITAPNGIYLLECQGFYKIGIASDVVKRVKSLQVGNPFGILVVLYCKVKAAQKLETKLHKAYSKKNIGGEWFRLTKNDVKNIKKIIGE